MKGRSRLYLTIVIVALSVNCLGSEKDTTIHAKEEMLLEDTKQESIKVQNMDESYEWDNVSVVLINNKTQEQINDKKGMELESYKAIADNTVFINGMESFRLDDFTAGKTELLIQYTIKRNKDYILMSGKSMEELFKEQKEYNLDDIPFTLSTKDIYWRISNENGSWGIGIKDIGVPKIIEELLPDRIEDVKGVNTITQVTNNEIIGYVTLNVQNPQIVMESEVLIDLLELPEDIRKEVSKNQVSISKLEIKANYSFKIPLFKDNNKNTESKLDIDGMATLDSTLTVID